MIYFLRTRYHYAPYDDFFTLATLAGYEVRYLDEVETFDSKDNVYIISPVNGEWNHWAKGYVRGKLILYELEYNVDGNHVTPSAVDEVWAGDKWQAETNGFRYVPMGSDRRLDLAGERLEDYPVFDIALMAYRDVYRRSKLIHEIQDAGVTIAPNDWGLARSIRMLESYAMVHIHQWDNIPAIAPLRWCLAAAHNLPIISETVADRGIFGYTHMMQADYSHLARFVGYVLKDKRLLADYAAALHHLLCDEYTFKRGIESHV